MMRGAYFFTSPRLGPVTHPEDAHVVVESGAFRRVEGSGLAVIDAVGLGQVVVDTPDGGEEAEYPQGVAQVLVPDRDILHKVHWLVGLFG